MEMKELDNLQYTVQILNGIRDIMMLMESSTIREVPISVCIVSEIAAEKAISLLGRVEEAVGKEIKRNEYCKGCGQKLSIIDTADFGQH